LTKRDLDVLLVIEGEIATTHLIERVLLACEPHGVRYRKQFLFALKTHDFHSNTIPLFVRCGDPALEYWIDLLRRAKHPYMYYIDDNFWRIKGDSPIARYYSHPVIRHSLEFAIANASSVLTNSDELSVFLACFSKHVKTLPAFFDFSLIDGCVSEGSEEIRIGFAGSPSRADDLDIIRPVIFPILETYKNVVFEFAGVMPNGISQSGRVRFFPHTGSYSEFIRFQVGRNWSIGLAPLIDSEANRCKTNNKYREYGASKIAGIYSDLQPYKRSVMQGVTGLLVENSTEAWFSAISWLVSNSLERSKMGGDAYEDVKIKHCVERVSGVWASSFDAMDRHIRAQPNIPLQTVSRRLDLNKVLRKFDAVKVQVAAAYNIGGFSLVMLKSLKRIVRIMRAWIISE